MPYTYYESFGNARVTNDLSTRGYYVGSAARTRITRPMPYGGAAIGLLTPSGAITQPGANANDPFCASLSGKNMSELWASGGFACYWRGVNWIPTASICMPLWIDDQWAWPTTSALTGSYIGTSPDNQKWTFSTIGGAQNVATVTRPVARSNPVYDSTTGQMMWLDQLANNNLVCRYGNPNLGFSEQLVFASTSAQAVWHGMHTSGGITIAFGQDGTFNRVLKSTNGGAGPWTLIPSGGNVTMISAARSQVNTDAWLMAVESSGYYRSLDNMNTTAFSAITGVSQPRAFASSPTSVVAVGTGGSIARCTTAAMDAADWVVSTITPAPGNIGYRTVAYGNGIYVAIADNASAAVSTDDGITWQNISPFAGYTGTSSIAYGASSLSFQNGKFVFVVADGTVVAESVDGVNWDTVGFYYSSSLGGSSDINPITGVFIAQQPSGTPVSAAGQTGFTINGTITQTSPYLRYRNSQSAGTTTTQIGVNQWHEFQIVWRPTGTTGLDWDVTMTVDDEPFTTVTTTLNATQAAGYPWFNVSRRGVFTNIGALVMYEFAGNADQTVLGPDLRIYDDVPTSDDETEWNPYNGTLSNAQNIATGTVTNPPTYVSESGVNKVDQYNTSNTVPAIAKVLSVKNEAFFSRMLNNPAYVQVGTEYSGIDTDSMPIQAVAPVNSFNYVSQVLPTNPVTGNAWTQAQLSSTRLRIKRADNAPVTTLLVHADTQTGNSTPYAINVGGGTNTLLGSAAVITTDSKFGGGCLQIPSGSSWAFSGAFGGPGNSLGLYDWTVECFVKTTATGNSVMWSMDTSLFGSSFGGILMAVSGLFVSNANNAWNLLATPSASFNNGQWRHVAVCRLGSLFYVWIDGQPGGSSPAVNADTIGIRGNAGVLSFGSTSGNVWPGLIDEIRVSRGARYTTAFTPPTAPFTS